MDNETQGDIVAQHQQHPNALNELAYTHSTTTNHDTTANMHTTSLATGLCLALTAQAHLFLASPSPIPGSAPKDPLAGDGSNFPCHGASLPTPGGTPMPAGSSQLLSFDTGNGANTAVHGGGSCQISITYETDAAKVKDPKNWLVIYSIEGGCPTNSLLNLDAGYTGPQGAYSGAIDCTDPRANGVDCVNQFNFTIPKGVKDGHATLAWTWMNNVGNREFYMNCVNADLSGGDGSEMAGFPSMFVANLGSVGSCPTTAYQAVAFPDPGKYVTTKLAASSQSTTYAIATPTGAGCAGDGGGSGSGSGSGGSGGVAPTSYGGGGASASAPAASSAAAAPSAAQSAAVSQATGGAQGGSPLVTVTTMATVTGARPTTGAGGTSGYAASPAAPSAPASSAPPSYGSGSGSGSGSSSSSPAGSETSAGSAPDTNSGSGSSSGASPSSSNTNSSGSGSCTGGAVSCATPGAVVCISSTSFGLCDINNCAVPQPVSDGTTCSGGVVARRHLRHGSRHALPGRRESF
ncbi:hypothetical protein LTR53_001632 [Teratosphaeriaceae sp. CCFEE 6253]|nr:hypothetical protein LTR53_001632 [Teratosphaeriaceae sp. CCFEE 6253]